MLIKKHIDWSTHNWLWHPDAPAENAYVHFYHNCFVGDNQTDTADQAWIAIACTGHYKLYVNQQRIHCGPCREVAPFFAYDVLDLSSYLQTGDNELHIIAYHAGIPTQSSGADQAGLLISGRLDSHDLSDATQWQSTCCAQHQKSWRLGGCLGWAEHLDLRLVNAALQTPQQLCTFTDTNSQQAIARSIPALGGDFFTADIIRDDETGILLDFKQEVLGLIHVHFIAAQDASIDISYAEMLSNGTVNHRKQQMDYRDRLDFSAGTIDWESFDVRAGRYLLITCTGKRQQLSDVRVTIHEQHYPFAPARLPERATDKRICSVAARTITLCSEDIQSDCPWRERAQYLDPYAYISAMQMLFNDLRPIKKWLLQLARGCQDRGYLPMCYPSAPSNTVIPDFQAIYALALQRYWEHSQDIDTVNSCYDAAALALTDLSKGRNDAGLLDAVPGWLFIDNSFQLSRRPVSSALNASYAGAIRAMQQLALALGKQTAAQEWHTQYQQLRQTFRRTFVKNNRLLDSLHQKENCSWWNHHATAAGNEQTTGYLAIRCSVHGVEQAKQSFFLAHYAQCKIIIDGQCYYDEAQHGTWTSPPLDAARSCPVTIHNGSELLLIYAYSAIDWEVYLGCEQSLTFQHTQMQVLSDLNQTIAEDQWLATAWHPHERPRLSQVSVGLAAEHGLLEDQEAQDLLRACLVDKHFEPWRKRTTPFFVHTTQDREKLARNILPPNTPWALYPFCCALRRYGMLAEAQDILRTIYQGMLDQDATSFWEEWGSSSSLCHAWSAFVAEFLLEPTH